MLKGRGKKKPEAGLPESRPAEKTELPEKALEAVGGPEGAEAAQEAAEKVPAAEEKLAEVQDKYLRAVAELENYKKRAEKDRIELSSYIKVALFRDLLPVIDDFNRFFEHLENGESRLDPGFVQGVELIHKSLLKLLEKHSVEPIEKTGVKVDYNFHEAVLTGPVADKDQDHTVVQVFEVGYRMGDKLIRPARVKVGIFSQ